MEEFCSVPLVGKQYKDALNHEGNAASEIRVMHTNTCVQNRPMPRIRTREAALLASQEDEELPNFSAIGSQKANDFSFISEKAAQESSSEPDSGSPDYKERSDL